MSPPVATLFLSLMDLKRFRKMNSIRDPTSFRESVFLNPTSTEPMFNHSQAAEIFDWLIVSENPMKWSNKFNEPEATNVIRTGARKIRSNKTTLNALNHLSQTHKVEKTKGGGILTDREPRLPSVVNAIVGPDSFGSNPLFYEFSDVAESMFFWVRELEESGVMPEIGIAIEGLNMQAPMTVEAISQAVSDLLSPVPIPFGSVMTGVIGQIAALPFVFGVSYLNLSREDYFEAARIGIMFLPIVGPFVSSTLKTGTHVYEKVMDKWNQIIDIPNRIMIVPNKIMDAVTKVTDRLSGMGLGASMDLTQASSLLNNLGEGLKANIPSDIGSIGSLGDLKGALAKRAQNSLGVAGLNVDLSGVSSIGDLASKFNPESMKEAAKGAALEKLNTLSPVKIPNVSSIDELKDKLNPSALKEAAKITAKNAALESIGLSGTQSPFVSVKKPSNNDEVKVGLASLVSGATPESELTDPSKIDKRLFEIYRLALPIEEMTIRAPLDNYLKKTSLTKSSKINDINSLTATLKGTTTDYPNVNEFYKLIRKRIDLFDINNNYDKIPSYISQFNRKNIPAMGTVERLKSSVKSKTTQADIDKANSKGNSMDIRLIELYNKLTASGKKYIESIAKSFIKSYDKVNSIKNTPLISSLKASLSKSIGASNVEKLVKTDVNLPGFIKYLIERLSLIDGGVEEKTYYDVMNTFVKIGAGRTHRNKRNKPKTKRLRKSINNK
jgi:hypothetical protein